MGCPYRGARPVVRTAFAISVEMAIILSLFMVSTHWRYSVWCRRRLPYSCLLEGAAAIRFLRSNLQTPRPLCCALGDVDSFNEILNGGGTRRARLPAGQTTDDPS